MDSLFTIIEKSSALNIKRKCLALRFKSGYLLKGVFYYHMINYCFLDSENDAYNKSFLYVN